MNFNIRSKLLFAVILIVIVAVVVTGYQSYDNGKDALETSVFNQMKSVRDTKKSRIEMYFNTIRNQILTFSEDIMIINAMKEFKQAFYDIHNKQNIDDAQLNKFSQTVMGYYQNEFLPRLNNNLVNKQSVDKYFPPDKETMYLQYWYLANNPNPTGEKDNLDQAPDGSEYSKIHAKYHPKIRSYLKKFGYYDIFLVDPDTGHIIYTVFKEVDYTTSLLTGPYAKTNFGEAFRSANNATDKDFVTLKDFKPYDPSYHAPASFIASPIFDGDKKIGVLLFQMPVDIINQVMTNDQKWEEMGLGKSGETYLVGDDFEMRSMSRFLIEDPEGYYAALKKAGYTEDQINDIKSLETSILQQKVETDASKAALNSEVGTDIINDYRDVPVLSAYTPLDIFDVKWALMAEIDEEEAFAPVYSLRDQIFLWGSIILILAAIGIYIYATKFTKPIISIGNAAKEVAKGDVDVSIEVKSNDEIGELGNSFKALMKYLKSKANAADELAKGNLDVQIEKESERDNLSNSMILMKDSLNKMADETKELIKAAIAGRLDTRGNAEKFEGGYREIVDGINKLLNAVIGPLNVAAEYVDRISKGDLPPKITDDYNGDFNEIKNNLNTCIDAVDYLVSDARMLSENAAAGKLDVRADADNHGGDFRVIIQGVNDTLDNIIKPLNVAAEYVDRISKGDIPPKITDEYNGDFNEIKNNLNTCIDAVDYLVSDARMLSENAAAGKLDVRADADNHGGDFRVIIQGVNDTLDNIIKPLNVAAEYMDRISKGDIPPKITDDYNGDFNEIKNNLNTCIDAVDYLVSDAKMLSENAAAGKLDVRADADNHGGDFRVIIQGVNDTLDNIIKPLNVAAEYVDRISKGDIPPKITDDYNGDFNEIKNNLNTCIDAVDYLVSDAKMLSENAAAGKLDVRADADNHGGDFRVIIQGVNDTLDNIIKPLNVAAEYVDRISKGDIPPKITDDYNGDFNEIKNNLNVCIDSISLLVSQAKELANYAIKGNITERADETKLAGDFNRIIKGVNKTLDTLVGFIDSISTPIMIIDDQMNILYMNEAGASLDNKVLTELKGTKCFDHFKTTDCNTEKCACRQVIRGKDFAKEETDAKPNNYNLEIEYTAVPIKDEKGNVVGALEIVFDQTEVKSALREAEEMADKVKKEQEYVKQQMDHAKLVSEYQTNEAGKLVESLEKLSNGDFDFELATKEANEETKEVKEVFDKIAGAVMTSVQAIRDLAEGTKDIAQNAADGNLSFRADSTRQKGEFARIIEGFNHTLDVILDPINEANESLSIMATGDLTARMHGNYKGDHQKLKDSINSLGKSLGDLIMQVSDLANTVNNVTSEITESAQTMAAGTEEASSQTSEVASAVEQMSRTITENAMSASKTSEVAQKNGSIAEEGGDVVLQTVEKMREIANIVTDSAKNIEKLGESSKKIGEISSVIDDIADQTNLLALNAAIEAARAGEQGRGFAVVADEVRKLAERTAEATQQIAAMIKGIQNETDSAVSVMTKGTEEVTVGITLADKAGISLKEVVTSSKDVMDMINQIAAASEQQSSTSEQIAKNVGGISDVTSNSARKIQGVVSSAEDLKKLTSVLIKSLSKFNVDENGNSSSYSQIDNEGYDMQIPNKKDRHLLP